MNQTSNEHVHQNCCRNLMDNDFGYLIATIVLRSTIGDRFGVRCNRCRDSCVGIRPNWITFYLLAPTEITVTMLDGCQKWYSHAPSLCTCCSIQILPFDIYLNAVHIFCSLYEHGVFVSRPPLHVMTPHARVFNVLTSSQSNRFSFCEFHLSCYTNDGVLPSKLNCWTFLSAVNCNGTVLRSYTIRPCVRFVPQL